MPSSVFPSACAHLTCTAMWHTARHLQCPLHQWGLFGQWTSLFYFSFLLGQQRTSIKVCVNPFPCNYPKVSSSEHQPVKISPFHRVQEPHYCSSDCSLRRVLWGCQHCPLANCSQTRLSAHGLCCHPQASLLAAFMTEQSIHPPSSEHRAYVF